MTPLYGTPRRPDRPTTGAVAATVARRMRVRLMPWQQHALDVAGELVPDPDTGQLVHAYSTVVVSVGRRGGKSLLTLVRAMSQVIGACGQRAWYTAQSRGDAAITLRDDWLPQLMSSPVAGLLRPRESNGSEAVLVPARNSLLRLFAPTPTSLHGQAGDLVLFDEAWSHSLARGSDLMVAARPLMATRPGAQQWVLSAAGDADSTWWIDWLDRGRLAARADTGRGVCHLEWSADRDDLDPDDPDTWLLAHPAVRHPGNPAGTITLDWLREEHERDAGQFRRVYLNVTDRTGTTASPIDVDVWDMLAVPPPERAGTIVLAVDCAPDQAATALVACHYHDGVPIVELVDHRPGTGWAPARIVELVDRFDLHSVALDPGAPAGALLAPLQAAAVPVVTCQLQDITAAAAQFVEAVATSTVRHVPHPALDAAVTDARRRNIGDGSWSWGRRTSDTDVSPLVAAGLARYTHPLLYGTPAGIT